MIIKGFESAVNVSVVTNPSSFSSESMSLVSGTHKWKIDNTDYSLFMVGEKPTIYDNGSLIPSQYIIGVDHLFGMVEIDTANYGEVTGSVTASGNYYDTLSIMTGAKNISLTLNTDLQDVTGFSSTGSKSKKEILKDATISIDKYLGDSTEVEEAINNSDMVIVEWVLGVDADDLLNDVWDGFDDSWDTYTDPFGISSPTTIRALCLVTSFEESGDASSISDYSLSLELGDTGTNSAPITIWTE